VLNTSPIAARLRRHSASRSLVSRISLLTALALTGWGCVAEFPATATYQPIADVGLRDSTTPLPDARPLDAAPDATIDASAAAEVCNGTDDDGDGQTDEEVPLRACPLQSGVCAASRRPCLGAAGYGTCEYTQARPPYEVTERRCDQADNDCDGTVDEGCNCMPGDNRDCGSDLGVCRRGRQLCVDGTYGICQGAVGPGVEACDGLDADCDGVVDNPPSRECTTDRPGRCEKGRTVCGGAGEMCVAVEAPAEFDRCDGEDEDCDGAVDEDADRGLCDTQLLGICGEGQLLCVGGRRRCTASRMAAPEVLDGLDNDCDGRVDEVPPLRLDLADLAVGGDGTRPGQGAQSIRLDGELASGGFQPAGSPALDGAFSPSEEGLTPIDSAGSTFDFSPEVAEAHVGDPLAKGPSPAWQPINGRPDYAAPEHTLIELRPNTGLTFDLSVIREAQGQSPRRLTLRFGNLSPAPIIGLVLVDGVRHVSADVVEAGETLVDIALNNDARTLSIAIVARAESDLDAVRTYVGDATLEFGAAD
jgi:hypothetical protein